MVIAASIVSLLAILVVLIVLVRFRKRSVAAFHRAVTNRIAIRFAAQLPGFAIVTTLGRKSGRLYRTPVDSPVCPLLPQRLSCNFPHCALAHLGRHSDHPHRIPTTPRRSPKLCSDSQIRSNPIAHRVRRKRQRLSPSLLIENASDRGPRSPKVCPEAFPIEASDKSAITRLHRRRPFLPYKLKVFCRTANQTVHKLDNVHVKDNRAALRSRPTPAQQVESIT